MDCLRFVNAIIQKESLVSSRTKTNYTTCNQLAVLTVHPFKRTGKAFMACCPIDDIFVEIKMTSYSYKFRNLKPQDALKLCFKKEKPILFSEEI